jgi:hypothetical protein
MSVLGLLLLDVLADDADGRSAREQLHVVVFAVHFHPRSLRARADLGEDAARDVDLTCGEHTAARLCYGDPNACVA